MQRGGKGREGEKQNRSSRTAISYSRVASCLLASSLLSAMMLCSKRRTAAPHGVFRVYIPALYDVNAISSELHDRESVRVGEARTGMVLKDEGRGV